ncbi:hypothetical protein HYE67_002052 [Fusarium culmorum]|uniref:Uncharacterized protein n=1 Tax=Fusarium culmorum TaxID=5516 RepID=A0A7S8D0P6_FUSCU|nr:hypothetical protein HYE67_002052 [Fusarium culmorum]
MEASQEYSSRSRELFEKAFTTLVEEEIQSSPDQGPIIEGAMETICNYLAGDIGLTKDEHETLMEYTTGLHEAEQPAFANALANMIRISRPEDRMTDADTEFLSFTNMVTDTVAGADMTDAGLDDLLSEFADQGLALVDGSLEPSMDLENMMGETHEVPQGFGFDAVDIDGLDFQAALDFDPAAEYSFLDGDVEIDLNKMEI